MSNKAVLVLVVIVAAGAVFWLLGGADLFTGASTSSDGSSEDARGTLTDAGADDAAEAEAAGGKTGSPVLFGRGRAQRKGVGGLMGRVMDFRTGTPVGNARVMAAGTGYGGEVTALQVATDAQGRFQYAALAAGDGYTLHISGDDKLKRTLAGVSVEADDVKDLGTLWLGERGVLEGVVVDAEGTGIVDARVEVHRGGSLLALLENMTDLIDQLDKDAKPLREGTSKAGGRFRIADVDPGPSLLVVRAPGFRLRMHEIVMTSEGAAGGPVRLALVTSEPVLGTVVDENGRGIAGARVACLQKNDLNAAFYGRVFTTTDAEGRFRIDSPPSQGGFSLIAAAEGYPTLFAEAQPQTELRLVLVGGAEVTVRLLEKGSERPIEGAKLMAMFGEKANLSGKKMSYASGDTDQRGEATFIARPGVLSMIYFTHPDHGSGMYSPAVPKAMAASIVEGPEDLTVKKPRATFVFHVVKGITIVGRVADEQGTAIPGARISSLGGFGFGVKARSDAEGRYVLRGQTKSVMMVLARAPGYVQQDPQIQKKRGVLEPDAQGEMTFDIVMLRAATVAGRVVGADGAPLPGVRVRIGSAKASSMVSAYMSGGGESITSKDGRFVLADVSAGEKMYVMARLDGYLDGRSTEFAVTGGQAVQAPDLALERGARFRLKVLAPTGGPAKGVRVEVSVERTAEQIQWDPTKAFGNFADLTTNADGIAVLEDVPDGALTITASKEGFASARSSLKIAREHVKPDTEVKLSLREAHTLRGRVLNEEGEPVAKAAIMALSPPNVTDEHWIPTVTAEADKAGRFALEGLPASPLVIEVSAEGYRAHETPIADLRGEVEVRLEPIPADAKVRLAQIEKELMVIYAKFANVKNEAERDGLLARMRALQTEQADLQK